MATRALVTNDDGVDSAGLTALADAARAAGLEVTVAAPCWDTSGSSASLTAVAERGQVLVERLASKARPEVPVFGVQGAPAFIVRAAMYGVFGPRPDLVLSGINRGANIGRSVLHSGTVGAALTAATHGCPALAVSAEVGERAQWETAGAVCERVIAWLRRARPATVLSLNVPDRPFDQLRGLQVADLAISGTVQANVTELDNGFVPVTFADTAGQAQPGTDAAALAGGFASVTALSPLCEDRGIDLRSLVL